MTEVKPSPGSTQKPVHPATENRHGGTQIGVRTFDRYFSHIGHGSNLRGIVAHARPRAANVRPGTHVTVPDRDVFRRQHSPLFLRRHNPQVVSDVVGCF